MNSDDKLINDGTAAPGRKRLFVQLLDENVGRADLWILAFIDAKKRKYLAEKESITNELIFELWYNNVDVNWN